jgi:hypothetical protein
VTLFCTRVLTLEDLGGGKRLSGIIFLNKEKKPSQRLCTARCKRRPLSFDQFMNIFYLFLSKKNSSKTKIANGFAPRGASEGIDWSRLLGLLPPASAPSERWEEYECCCFLSHNATSTQVAMWRETKVCMYVHMYLYTCICIVCIYIIYICVYTCHTTPPLPKSPCGARPRCVCMCVCIFYILIYIICVYICHTTPPVPKSPCGARLRCGVFVCVFVCVLCVCCVCVVCVLCVCVCVCV